MSGWNAKYKNDFGEYEITFYSKDYEKTRAVEKVCCAIMDGKVKEAADVAPVRHGRWEYHECVSSDDGTISVYACSACRFCIDEEVFEQLDSTDYCPNCGATMDGENDG